MFLFALSANAKVTDLSSAMSQNYSVPVAVLIYADWADGYQDALNQFRKVQVDLGNSYNFVELNLASKDAKIYNDQYVIYPKLPYIMLLRTSGRFSMLVNRDCTLSSSCTTQKLKVFKR